MSERLFQIQEALNLTAAQAAAVLRMHDDRGWVSGAELQAVTARHMSGTRPWAVQQGVDAIRMKTAQPDFILGRADVGWSLGAPGVKAVRAIFAKNVSGAR